MTPSQLVVLGFGGHARSVADIAVGSGIRSLLFVDANAAPGEQFCGFPAVKECPDSLDAASMLFPAAGDNHLRERQVAEFAARAEFHTLVSPRAYVGMGAMLGRAVLIAHDAHVGPAASIGEGVIINTSAVVDHETSVGRFTHISVNATVCGRCSIGDRVFLGAGSVVVDGVKIADDVVVGAGAVVVGDLPDHGTYVGSPARRLPRRSVSLGRTSRTGPR